MMQVIEQEMAWRKANSRPEGFEALRACKPLVALGAEHPLEEKDLKFDHFRKSLLRSDDCKVSTSES